MDINSFNINKTNNHRTPQLIEYNNKTTPYGIGNLNPTWDIDRNMAMLNRLMRNDGTNSKFFCFETLK